jgi:hypothetical protein
MSLSFAQTMITKYLLKEAYIRKLPTGKYRVYSEKGKNMGTFDNHEQAAKHLRKVAMISETAVAMISTAASKDKATYSGIIRKLRKEGDDEKLMTFLQIFKEAFDQLVLAGDEAPADKALPITLFLLSRK